MTNAEIMAQILSEASGQRPEFVQNMIDGIGKTLGIDSLREVLPKVRAQQLLAQLHREQPEFRAWAAERERYAFEIAHSTRRY